MRLTCKWLRDAFDAWNTRLVLGDSEDCNAKERRAIRAREGCPKSIISRTPRLNSLVLKRWSCNMDTQLPFPWQQIKHFDIIRSNIGAESGSSSADLSFVGKSRVLERLDLSGWDSNTRMPQSLGSCCATLKRLVLGGRSVDYVSSLAALISSFTALEELELTNQGLTLDLAPIASGCIHLRSLKISLKASKDLLKPLALLSHLTSLELRITGLAWASPGNVIMDPTWDPLSACSSLLRLRLAQNRILASLQPLSALTALTHLDLSDCGLVQHLDPLSSCIGLQTVILSDCYELNDLAPLSSCTALRRLDLQSCNLDRSRVFPALWACSLLEDLDLSCSEAEGAEGAFGEDVSSFSSFQHLRRLYIGGSPHLRDIQHLSSLLGLRTLDLSLSVSLQDISPLRHLTSLRQLDLSKCLLLTSLTPLSSMASLRKLCLNANHGLDLKPLSVLVGLVEIDLRHSIVSHDMTVFSSLTNLKCLSLTETSFGDNIKDLAPLGHCVSLQYLDLRVKGDCTCRSLAPLAKCTKLRVLKIEPPDGQTPESCFECLYPLSSTYGLRVGVELYRASYNVSWDTSSRAWVVHEYDGRLRYNYKDDDNDVS